MGVVVANGFVILLFVTGADGDNLDARDLFEDDVDALDSFFEPKFFKLKGMLNFEDVLVCEQNVGVRASTILLLW